MRYENRSSSLPSVGHFCRPFTVKTPQKIGTGCANVIPSPATIFRLPSGQGFARHPASVRTCSMWFPVLFRFAHSLTTFGRWGCGERINLSHVVGNFIVVLLEMSRLVAPETRSQTLRRTKRVLNARQGMEGAKTLTEALRRSGAPKPRASGLRSSPELRDSAPRPCCFQPHGTGSYWLVGGRRPSVLQRWGSGVSQTVSGCAQGAAGTVLLEGPEA